MTKLLLLPLIAIFLSCSSDSIYQRIDLKMQSNDTESAIYMKDIITEKWDTMYVLQPKIGLTDNKNIYRKNQDIERRIVITNKGMIVYSEEEIAIETPYKVTFEIGEKDFFLREDAVFLVKQKQHHKIGKWYYLTLVDTTNNN